MNAVTSALGFTRPHLLRSQEEYDEALQMIDELLERNPRRGSDDHDVLEFLSVLVEAYEAGRYPREMFATTPQEAVDSMLGRRDCSAQT